MFLNGGKDIKKGAKTRVPIPLLSSDSTKLKKVVALKSGSIGK